MRLLIVIGFIISLTGCAIKQPGTRTFVYGPDGVTITSETTTGESTSLADIEKEKTRQVCYRSMVTKKKEIAAATGENQLVLVMLAQNESLNNAMSLIKTGKNYDPCPSSTNSSDVEIADADMYKSIYHDAFDLGKTVAFTWAGVEIFDNLTGALANAGGNSLINSGSGDINVTDSFKTSSFGNNATTGDLFSNPSTTITLAPAVAE